MRNLNLWFKCWIMRRLSRKQKEAVLKGKPNGSLIFFTFSAAKSTFPNLKKTKDSEDNKLKVVSHTRMKDRL